MLQCQKGPGKTLDKEMAASRNRHLILKYAMLNMFVYFSRIHI